jgi:hypothetical protein
MYLVRRPAIVKRRGRRVRFLTTNAMLPGPTATGFARQDSAVIAMRTSVWAGARVPGAAAPTTSNAAAATTIPHSFILWL